MQAILAVVSVQYTYLACQYKNTNSVRAKNLLNTMI